MLCYFAWVRVIDTEQRRGADRRRLIYYPRARVSLTNAGYLNTEVCTLSFQSVKASLWSLVFFLVACVRLMLSVQGIDEVSFIGVLALTSHTLRWEELLLADRDVSVIGLSRLWEELLLGLLHRLLTIEVLLHPVGWWRNQGLWLRVHETWRLYHVSHGLNWILIGHPAHILVAICSWVRWAHLKLWSHEGSHLHHLLV